MATDLKATILKELDTLRKADLARKKPFQARAYATAIEALKGISSITTVEDVKGLKGVGAKITEKIQEILTTGSLRAAEEARKELPLDAYEVLQTVHGIGPVKAKALVKDGITTIEALREAAQKTPDLLTAAQTLGLKYVEDAVKRIPRSEMKEHEEMILSALDPLFQGTVVGSYRRGADSSGDIDVLLTLPNEMTDAEKKAKFLHAVKLFKEVHYIVDTLSSGGTKFLGYCQLEGNPVRRLDLLMVPASEYAYAILYFTGSQEFNVAYRSYALEKGYTLNEHRMEPTKEGVTPVPLMKTEEDIFAFLGLVYVAPTERKDSHQVKPLEP